MGAQLWGSLYCLGAKEMSWQIYGEGLDCRPLQDAHMEDKQEIQELARCAW